MLTQHPANIQPAPLRCVWWFACVLTSSHSPVQGVRCLPSMLPLGVPTFSQGPNADAACRSTQGCASVAQPVMPESQPVPAGT